MPLRPFLPPPPAAPGEDLTQVARRIAEAIRTAEQTPSEAQPKGIVFRVGGLTLALPLTAVREVVLPPAHLSKVPRAPAAVLGIMNLRGRVVALVDLLHALPPPLTARLTLPLAEPGADLASGRVLLLERGRREVGLLVASVSGIEPLVSQQIAQQAGDEVAGAPQVGSAPTLLDPDQVAQAMEALVA